MFYTSYKVSKSMEFVFGGVQKDFSCKHTFQHFTRPSWSLQNLIACDQPFLLSCTWLFYLWRGCTVYNALGYVIL